MTGPNLSDIRAEDGYYINPLEALRRAIEWIKSAEDREECEIPLPDGVIVVAYNSGVPFYLASGEFPNESSFSEVTASNAVAFMEGLYRGFEGVPVDPKLPDGFDNTPNDERPDSHQIWWNRPFIVTDRWEPETWEQYRDRLAGYGWEPDHTPDEWARMQAKQESGWYESFPSGVRYDVRCLDGGAWDRSTWWGSFGTLQEAITCAGDGPEWRPAAG